MPRMIPLKHGALALTLFFLTAIFLAPVPVMAGETPRILVLNSYNSGYDWSDDELKGIRAELARKYPRVNLYIENLDTKNFHKKNHFPAEASVLQAKYSTKKLDAVIAMDNAALEFATTYRNRILPGIPLVFCGINDYEPGMIKGEKNITGVAEFHDSAGTMELALKLHPNVRTILLVHDYTDTGLAMRHEVEKAVTRFPGIKLEFLEELPLEKAVERLKQLPADHLVLTLSYTVEKGGRTFTQQEAAQIISNTSSVPVYAIHDAQLGYGVVGGIVMNGKVQGQKAAELVYKILSGTPTAALPVITENLSHPKFDYLLLKRFSIDPAKLPPGSEIINKPSTTVAIKKEAAFVGITIGTVTFAAVIVLLLSVMQQKKLKNQLDRQILEYQETQEELQATEEMLRNQVDEYMRSQDELQATEEMLRQQIAEYQETHDQLLATEEMLRVQLELAEESVQKFKAVFDHSPITVALTTLPDGRFCETNNTFTNMFGYSREEALGKSTLELALWVDEKERDSYLAALRETAYVSNFEAAMRRKDGSEITVLFSGSRIEIAGSPYVLSAVIDISEQRRLQHQLHQTQKMDVIGQLAGGVAHDFNNMLSGIMGAAEMLKYRIPHDDKNLKLIDTILNATNRSADLTRQLLSFSRKEKLLTRPVLIDDAIDTTIKLLARTIDKKIEIKSRLTAPDPIVLGDATLLQSALLNLGINARDAMPDGGTICYSTAGIFLDSKLCQQKGYTLAPGMYVEISVSDTGLGMSRDVVEHIFEPFFTTKAEGKGTGLGLAAVYGTVRNHEGTITVQSEPGVGSVFKIYLPLVQQDHQVASENPEIIHGNGMVLLVDDEEILRAVGGELLEELGYKVCFAENGEQALEIYEELGSKISLVLLDMIMPKMGGKETLISLREKNPDVKVLFCSGFHQEGNDQELIALGAQGLIQKPYNRAELSRAVAKAIG